MVSRNRIQSDQLLERTVERRAKRLDVLVELNGGSSALGDALWGELEFLDDMSVKCCVKVDWD